MAAGSKKSRKWLIIGAVCAVPAIAAVGLVTLRGASPEIDPARLAVAERGTMVRSVVATGKVEPITKVEIKSKANGLINVLRVDVDTVVNEGRRARRARQGAAAGGASRRAGQPRGGAGVARGRRSAAQEERRRSRGT